MLCLVVAPAAVAASCPTTTNAKAFASAAQLRKLVRQENSFGERFLASTAHNRTIGWIKDEVRAIDGFKVRSDPFKVWTLAATDEGEGPAGARPRARRRPELTRQRVDARCRWPARSAGPSRPGRRASRAQLVNLAADQDITAANAAGQGGRPRLPRHRAAVRRVRRSSASTSRRISRARAGTTSARSSTSCTRSCSPRAGPGPRESSSPSTCRASRCAATATRTPARSSRCRRCTSAARRRSG